MYDLNDTMKLYVEKQQLHINCLSDPDRIIRTRGLDSLHKNIFPKDEIINPICIQALLEKLISPLLKCFNDKIEKIRGISIDLVDKLLSVNFGNYNIEDKIIGLIINTVISRANHIPFLETSEELRQNLIKLLHKILQKYPNDLLPMISDLSSMVAKLLTDPCPEVKIKLSELLIELSEKLHKNLGPHSKAIIISLCGNLRHAHNKIRKITLTALTDILLCDNAGKFFEEAVPLLKIVSNDKHYDVRKAFYACIYKLLVEFNIVYLRKNEHQLVIFLMNGLSDEKNDIGENCELFLEQKLAVELEEDLSELIPNDGMIVDK